MPLNLHRLVGNVTFGGSSPVSLPRTCSWGQKRRGSGPITIGWVLVSNMIGVALLFLPFMGYLLAYSLCD